MHGLLLALPLAASVLPLAAPAPLGVQTSESLPLWIWLGGAAEESDLVFQRAFEVDVAHERAWLYATCDNRMTV
ncbi:MAG: hypothetical protein AAGB93_06785, partial [Planctomycetota bacterium]